MTDNENLKNIFSELSTIDLRGKTDEKLGLTYLSWAWAWTILKQKYPSVKQKIYTHEIKVVETVEMKSEGMTKTTVYEHMEEVNYFTDGKTAYVKVGVDIDGYEEVVTLPVMNMKNLSIPVGMITSVDVNRAIQRAFVKAAAMHGLGLYIYAGEKEPESEPIVIDWKALAQTADSVAVPEIGADEFQAHLNNVLQMVQKYGADPTLSDQIVQYIQPRVNCKLSALTFNEFGIVYRIETFLRSVAEIVGE